MAEISEEILTSIDQFINDENKIVSYQSLIN